MQADTIDDLLVDAQVAAASHLDALHEDGQPVPDVDDASIASFHLPEPSVA